MDRVSELFDGLKSQTEALISAVQSSGCGEHINDMAIGVLTKIVETEQRCKQLNLQAVARSANAGDEGEAQRQISKVRNKLENWARPEKQHQKGVRVLNTFLELEARGGEVTVDGMRRAYGNDPEFISNYPQMKNMSSKNHGKFFEETGGVVRIWGPVAEYVDEYRKKRAVLRI